jgi:spermidine synthase
VALLWELTVDDRTYEVRTAGSTLRLYTNGAFHSQYNPNNPVTGNVWDLLFLPSMFAPEGTIKRVLVLGVGGGAVIQQLNYFIKPTHITGIELDPVHLMVARDFFHLSAANIELVCDDARSWLEEYQGEPFDLIIDDLFIDGVNEAYRPYEADVSWFELLLSKLNEDGTLVINFGDEYELQDSGYFDDPKISQHFRSAFHFSTPLYENAVASFHRRYHQLQTLKEHLQLYSYLDERKNSCKLNYALKALGSNPLKG